MFELPENAQPCTSAFLVEVTPELEACRFTADVLPHESRDVALVGRLYFEAATHKQNNDTKQIIADRWTLTHQFAISPINDPTVRAVIARGYRYAPRFSLMTFCRVLRTGIPETEFGKDILAFRNWLLQQTNRNIGTRRLIFTYCEFVLRKFLGILSKAESNIDIHTIIPIIVL